MPEADPSALRPAPLRPDLSPPRAAKRPVEVTRHGDTRTDDYAWLRDPGYPEVSDPDILAHLDAENAYREAVMAPFAGTRRALFEEMKARIRDDDESVPYRVGDWFYRRRYPAGAQYWVLERARDEAGPYAPVLDRNALAEGRSYCAVRQAAPSPDGTLLAYTVDFDGSERFVIRVRDLATGADLPDAVPNTQGVAVWSACGRYLFYLRLDDQLRARTVCRHRLGEDPARDRECYHEADTAFLTSIHASSDAALVVVSGGDHDRREVRILRTDDPDGDFRCVAPRRAGHEYAVDHHTAADGTGTLYVLTNDRHENFRLASAPPDAPGEENWREEIAPSDAVYLEDLHLFRGHLVVAEREGGLPQVRVRRLSDGQEHRIAFDEPAYDVGLEVNRDFGAPFVRLSYTSLVTPDTVLDYAFESRVRTVRKVREVPSGYDPAAYVAERLFAPAADGAMVPVSIVRRRDTPVDGSAPLYLYAYGSYGAAIDPTFSTHRLSLLDRGWVYALAHPRGGSEMGRAWYRAGKLAHKTNSFDDVIAVARHLAATGHTAPGRITVAGGSAGGLMVGAVINRAEPGLFRAAVAHVPFVDVLDTMLDDGLWLTASEFTEWGNPIADPEAYARIKGYSPYDNVTARDYPHLFVTGGIADPRVTYWEPAKWVARLRDRKTDGNLLLLRMNMDAGHGGASGRWDWIDELAEEYAFLLMVYGQAVPDGG